jgi:GMP synthase-like glutamine amidotransferase
VRIHVLQHVPFEGPANVGVWATRTGHDLAVTNLHHGDALPPIDAADALVVLGGLMSVTDEHEYPWLVAEKAFLREYIATARPVLGICLGAQLLAECLGGTVRRNDQREIGWHEVTLTPAARRIGPMASWPDRMLALHWHGDTFSLPPDAERIASSPATAEQGFVYGGNVLALQFHIEYSVGSIELMLKHCGHELVDGPFVQNPERIRADIARNVARTKRWLDALLDSWLGRGVAMAAS